MVTSPPHSTALRLVHAPVERQMTGASHHSVEHPRIQQQCWSNRKRIDFAMLVLMPVVTVLLFRSCDLGAGIAQAMLNTVWFLQTLDDFNRRR